MNNNNDNKYSGDYYLHATDLYDLIKKQQEENAKKNKKVKKQKAFNFFKK